MEVRHCIYARMVDLNRYIVYRLDNISRKVRVGTVFNEEEIYKLKTSLDVDLVLTLGDK